MEITIVGSGTCVPSLKRSSCSVLIEVANERLLFDTGAGTLRRLLELEVDFSRIPYIFFSHLHTDHTGELCSFLFAMKNPETYRRTEGLRIVAAQGFLNFYERLKDVYGEWIELGPDLIEIIELYNNRADHRDFGTFRVDTLPVVHTTESIAYRITSRDGKSVVYSGDTDFCDNLVTLSEDADLLICESSLPDEIKVPGHMTPSLAGLTAEKAGAKRLILTHLYPECESVDIAEQCGKTYTGDLMIAEDSLKVSI
ncbi:MAG: ribonuclease Z [Deltaproteobacteria bacterium]|jgi:ribonuclease BN (tRNA processing enzyme)|nr:ribonuclease Z [Desulfobacterales bacterium]MDL1974469.1 ribonuclease Z [Deltaproteobacteria bacterium]